jgi:hypothetical protein
MAANTAIWCPIFPAPTIHILLILSSFFTVITSYDWVHEKSKKTGSLQIRPSVEQQSKA